LVDITIPFETGKLAQEGSAFARKRNPTNFLFSARDFAGRAAILRCGNIVGSIVGSERCGRVLKMVSARPVVEVPLDGAETKSEDYQMDTGTESAQTQRPL
jgi:hypothetical protein